MRRPLGVVPAISPQEGTWAESLTNSTHCPETQAGLSPRWLHRRGEGGLLWINGSMALFATSGVDFRF